MTTEMGAGNIAGRTWTERRRWSDAVCPTGQESVELVKSRKLLRRLTTGAFQNVRFNDLVRLATDLGFQLARVQGSHHVFTHPEVTELLNVQDVNGEAKPYQLRQLLRLVERYNLKLQDEP